MIASSDERDGPPPSPERPNPCADRRPGTRSPSSDIFHSLTPHPDAIDRNSLFLCRSGDLCPHSPGHPRNRLRDSLSHPGGEHSPSPRRP
ncbi:hypothetical protein MCA1573 [Methylococcus capsulatus str. Bath]|uniref:Uncharacterized protein n=1 Tax=Methylococcus capsulatus (strain ATCC 33009 / NCIMB 11132 / Bath) TaxID=243233 RepID=Q608C4_METCA|nr:hypothetical protein MCA1573 [Methylococcus capsulatus str. Bath]